MPVNPTFVCHSCKQDLPRSQFDTVFARGRVNGVHVRCRSCRADIAARKSPSPVNHGDGTLSVPLTGGKFALIDEVDWSIVSRHCWHVRNGRNTLYAVANEYIPETKGGRKIWMHRLITDAPDGIQVDHINRDGLDNRRCNLRLATPVENQRNRPGKKNGTSVYKGVSWSSQHSKWRAQIYHDQRQHFVGLFHDEIDAARAYDSRAKEIHGRFAYLNFPHPDYVTVDDKETNS